MESAKVTGKVSRLALNHPHPTATAADLVRSVLALCRSWERNRNQYPSDGLVTWYEVETLGPVYHPAICSQADDLQKTDFHTGGSITALSCAQWVICDERGSYA